MSRWVWRAVLLGAVAVLLSTLFTGPLAIRSGSVTGSPAATGRAAPCLPGRAVAVMASPHIGAAQLAAVRYNSVPPTSGPHFSFTIAPGIYPEPVSAGLFVHALEHGHVAMLYAPASAPGTVAELRRLAKRYPRDVVVAPYPPLPAGVALTAWGRLDMQDRYDAGRAEAFVVALRGRYVHGWTRSDPC